MSSQRLAKRHFSKLDILIDSGFIERRNQSNKFNQIRDSEVTNGLREMVPVVDSNASTLRQELLEKVLDTRSRLNISEIAEFDLQWSIDSEEKFIKKQHLFFGCFPVEYGVTVVIEKEMQRVQQLSQLKIKKLKLATDEHAGLELLHLFVLDLLGRDTPAAQIFEQRSEEDFKRMSVVSFSAKCVAAVLLLLMNFFFAYFSVLYGFLHGLGWQRNYLVVCAVQLIVEVFINETLEVLWVHVLAPKLVREEVQSAVRAVIDLVNKMFSRELSSSLTDKNKDKRSHELNVPDYLFVSAKVAKSFPKLIESTIVGSFSTYLPGELSKKWRDVSSRSLSFALVSESNGTEFLSLSTAFLAAFSSLQYLAATPLMLQRMVVRSGQPVFVSLVLMVYSLMTDSPFYIGIFLSFPFLAICFIVYKYRLEIMSTRGSVFPVIPANLPELRNYVVEGEKDVIEEDKSDLSDKGSSDDSDDEIDYMDADFDNFSDEEISSDG